MSTTNYSPVGDKRGQKGIVTPSRIRNVEEVICKKGSTKTELITHRLVNIDDFSTVCQTCGVDWATLDVEARTSAKRYDRKRTAERAAHAKAKHEAEMSSG
jgi:hypothetical protein